MDNSTYKALVTGISAVLVGILMDFALVAVVMLLWNWCMPAVFELSTITFWQAFGITFLSKILFRGFNTSTKK